MPSRERKRKGARGRPAPASEVGVPRSPTYYLAGRWRTGRPQRCLVEPARGGSKGGGSTAPPWACCSSGSARESVGSTAKIHVGPGPRAPSPP
jgi:hypothetical protein